MMIQSGCASMSKNFWTLDDYQAEQRQQKIDAFERDPKLFVRLLEEAGGDVRKFVEEFGGDVGDNLQRVLTRVFLILNRPTNQPLRAEWDAQVEAFKEAQQAVAENKAFSFIGKYQPPEDVEGMKMTEFMSFAKFWMADRQEALKTRGKRDAVEKPSGQAQSELSEVIKKLEEKG